MDRRTISLIDVFASITSPGDLSLASDGSKIAFTLDVNGNSQIFGLPVARRGYPQRITASLTDCSDPQWSPDGVRLAYVQGSAIMVADADGSHARMIADHPSGNASPRWSPDGSRIAFYSRRRGWESVWMVSVEGGTATQITPAGLDAEDLAWSPDGRVIAYCSMSEDDLTTRGIYLIPSLGGPSRLISPNAAWSGAPHFSPDGRTVAFLSDRDGWFQTFLYDMETETTRKLTSDAIEDGGPSFYSVDRRSGPVFSPDGKQLALVRHREGNFDIWVVGVEEGRARCISQQDGHYHIVGWLPDGEHLMVTHETIACPPDLQILSLDGAFEKLTDSAVAEQRTNEMVFPEWINYRTRDGLTVHAGLLRPPHLNPKKAPAVLFLHGGPNFQFANFYYPLPELLAQAGYVVLAPNFRGSTGYGRAFRQANFGEWGHADTQDVIDAALWLRSQPFVDPDRIAVAGPSYGGYLTLSSLALEPGLFCAGIDLYGDSEIAESYYHGDRYGRLDLRRHMGTPEQNPEGYRRGSPFYVASQIQAPLLILHGKQDRLVVPLMSEKMIEALRIEGKYFESHFYEDEGHGLSKPKNKKDAWERILKFLDGQCRNNGAGSA